jgi:dienelactone hydrolase
MKRVMSLFVATWLAAGAAAAIHTQKIEYKSGGATFEGVVAYDDSKRGVNEGVMVMPEWWGVNDYAKKRAADLAGLGYVAMAVDMYGKDKVTSDPKQAAAWAGEIRSDRKQMRARAQAALEAFKKHPRVHPGQVAAIGYCLGGTVALEMARAGLPLQGVVSFHGGLDVGETSATAPLKTKVLVCTGADDPMVPPAQVAVFEDEMRNAQADWQVISYGGALHSFTNPDSTKIGMKGVGYDEKADKRSWQAMREFLSEAFSAPPTEPVEVWGDLKQ